LSVPFAAQYAAALLVVGLVLFALYYGMRIMGRARLFRSDRRLVCVMESTPLHNNGALHVVRVADLYYLIGANAGGISTLAQLPAPHIEESLKSTKTGQSGLLSSQ
jgi:flagellar biogenesis protein FliO